MIETDILIIGAGPCGLFTVFEAGLIKLRCHLIDALAQPGGQLSEIYPKKPIYDIPGIPSILAGELVNNLMEQAAPFKPGFTLGERAESIVKQSDGRYLVTTSRGSQHLAPVEERTKYVSNPKNHSLHNYGCAVDVTITDTLGNELDMGTEFDDFDTLAQPAYEWKCLQSGALSEHQLNNRKLLRSTMLRAGFRQLPSEWWHYNCCSREYAKQNFEVVE